MLKGFLALCVAFGLLWVNVIPVSSLIRYEETLTEEETNEPKAQMCIYGYVYVDHERLGIMKEDSAKIAGLYIKLWKDHDLLMVTQTNGEGYYQFDGPLSSATYTITIDQLDHYAFNQENISLVYEEGSSLLYNIGFLELEYKLHYDMNEGYGEIETYKELYYYQDTITVIDHQSIKKDGYVFGGWNTCKDGSGKTYQTNEFFSMPDHAVTLYAMWKRINSEAPSSIQSKYLENGNQVFTGDKGHVLFWSLLLLSSCGGMIIFKSLKKRKNR